MSKINLARRKALINNEIYYDDGRECKNGHLSLKRTKTFQCLQCEREATTRCYINNIENKRELGRKYYQENREDAILRSREYRKNNLEQVRIKDKIRRPIKDSKMKERTPIWADINAIKHFYILAGYFGSLLEEEFHVDHIIPLNGKYVSGLHIETNLQILPKLDNLIKANKYGEEIWAK